MDFPLDHHTFQESCHSRTTTAYIQVPAVLFYDIRPPTLGTDDDDVYGIEAGNERVSLVLQYYNGDNVMISSISFFLTYAFHSYLIWLAV